MLSGVLPWVPAIGWLVALRLVVGMTAFAFLPGFLLIRWLYGRRGLPLILQVTLALGVSLGLGIVLGSVVSLTGWSLAWLLAGLLAWDVALSILLALRGPREESVTCADPNEAVEPPNRWLLAALVVVTAIVFWHFLLPANQLNPAADSWSYVARITKWATFGPRSPLQAVTGTVEHSFRRIFGGWLLWQSLMTIVSGATPLDLAAWLLPPLLMIASYLAVYGLALTLFRSHNAAILSTLAEAIILAISSGTDDRIQRVIFWRIVEDKFLLTFVLLPILTMFAIRYLRSKRRSDLAGFLIMALALPLAHPLGLVEAGLSLGLFAVLNLAFNRKMEVVRRLAVIFVPLTVLLVIPLTQRGFVDETSYATTTDSDAALARYQRLHVDRLTLIDPTHNEYIVNFTMLESPMTLLALVVTPLLLFWVAKDMGAQFLFGNVVGLVFILFNPLLTPLLGRATTPWMLWRVAYVLPAPLIVGYLLDRGLHFVRERMPRPTRWEGALLALGPLTALATLTIVLGLKGQLGWPKYLTAQPFRLEQDILRQLESYLQEPTTVMVPKALDTLAPALVPQAYVPATRKTNFRPEAQADMSALYDTDAVDGSLWAILAKYDCPFIILEQAQVPSFFRYAPFLTELARNKGYVLYAIDPDAAESPLVKGHEAMARSDWEAASGYYEEALPEEPLLATLGLAEASAKQGQADKAQALYERAVAIAPAAPWPRYLAAQHEWHNGQPNQAFDDFAVAQQLASENSGLPTHLVSELVRLAQRDPSALSLAPSTDQERIGVLVNKEYGGFAEYRGDALGIGWYADWDLLPTETDRYEQRRARTVSVSFERYPPNESDLIQATQRHPGSIWLIGVEPESASGGNRTPAEYAEIYHDLYYFIKSRDVLAVVAVGGIAEPTPLRLQWLDEVMQAYEERYHEVLPAEAWQINNYIVREEAGSWGAGIPAGIEATTGRLYEVQDNASLTIFEEHVLAFRQWMADHGQRNKPLLISGYGVQMPSDYLVEGGAKAGDKVVLDYMLGTFNFLRTARSDSLGYPADDNRLVQKWLWHGLCEKPFSPDVEGGNNGMLFAYIEAESRRELTLFGGTLLSYLVSLPDTPEQTALGGS